jgi:glycerol-3-phosphate dehydrogenase
VRLVKGSHIAVPKLYDHDRAYLFQSSDGRVVFAIPYESEFTLIGTTDVDYAGDPAAVGATAEEIEYLCRVASDYFRASITPQQVVWSYAGVRPLYDDGASKAKDATRDYVLTLDAPGDAAPLLVVYGGKITTYRRLAEEALARLSASLAMGPPWTGGSVLPGGDLPWDGIPAFAERCRARWPFLSPGHALRLARAYGTRIERFLPDTASAPEALPGGAMTRAEIDYLVAQEWAQTADDILWRRTKLGLHLGDDAKSALAEMLKQEDGRRAAQ